MTLNEFKAFVEGVVSAKTTDSQALKLILEKLKTVGETPVINPAWVPRTTDKFYGPSPFEGPQCGGIARSALSSDDPYADRLVARG